MEEHSEYQYPVVLDESKQAASFLNIEDMLFEVFKSEDAHEIDSIALGQFVVALENTGLRRSDPRLAEMLAKVNIYAKNEGPELNGDILDQKIIDRVEFKNLIIENIVLISRALRHQLIIPEFREFTSMIDRMFEDAAQVDDGEVANYIPQLAKQERDQFGMSLCTVDGQRYSLGSAEEKFTLQSVCKALIYGIALNELGRDVVHKYLGMEPSGRRFNDMTLDYNKQPHNPLVNAGAILTISLLQKLVKPEMSMAEKFDYILNYFTRMAGGGNIGFNNSVFLAEREQADRNFAISYQLKEHGCFPENTNIHDCLDLWYQCCSMEVTCETVAVIAGTLAHGGVAPITGEKVLKPEAVRDVLSLLHSCGFYEYSGYFAFKVGIPGKSSVAGSMMMVLPNTMGICLWSPPLDKYGNSFRGLKFMENLIENFSFHRYEGKTMLNKSNPRRVKAESRGDTIVSLLYAAAAGDLSALKTHKFLGVDMNASDYDGRTPLHLAAAEGHKDCVTFLLYKCDVNPSPTDRWGFTPLSEAEKFGHKAVVTILQLWTTKDVDTLTSKEGQEMLKQIKTAQE